MPHRPSTSPGVRGLLAHVLARREHLHHVCKRLRTGLLSALHNPHAVWGWAAAATAHGVRAREATPALALLWHLHAELTLDTPHHDPSAVAPAAAAWLAGAARSAGRSPTTWVEAVVQLEAWRSGPSPTALAETAPWLEQPQRVPRGLVRWLLDGLATLDPDAADADPDLAHAVRRRTQALATALQCALVV